MADDSGNTLDSVEPQAPTPTGSDVSPASVPDIAAPEIAVAPDFDYVEMGENPVGVIQIDYEIKTGKE